MFKKTLLSILVLVSMVGCTANQAIVDGARIAATGIATDGFVYLFNAAIAALITVKPA
jgi:hypothetical protein